MKTRFLLAATCIVALAACNSNKGNSSANAANNSSSGNSAAAAPASGGAAGRAVDPQLAQEIQMVVGMLKGQLPIKQQTPEGELRVTNLEANGGEIIYTMELPNDLNEESFGQFEEQLPIRTCASAQARTLLERGGTYTYRLKDKGGEEFTTSVSSCS
jgi:hypothetical protein